MHLPRTRTGRIAAIVAAAVVLVLVASQIFLPGIGENAIKDRLTKNGGVAHVSLSAFPAAQLLWGSGDEIKIDGDGLRLDVEPASNPNVLGNLDPFGDVEITLHDTTAGPFDIDSLILTRHDNAPYDLQAHTSTSAAKLANYGFDRADLPGGGVVGDILNFTGIGGASVPVDLDMKIISDDGRVHVIEGGGTVAGLPTGPLAELLTTAITVKL